jgi:glycosyltransferase involved in cell wall biosynthesis
MDDLVSIIMPVYNGEPYIRNSIESVLSQSHGNWELLIINDGSTDNTDGIVKSFLVGNKIKYFTQSNKGVAAARNVGLNHMCGDFFCFLDADDIMPEGSVKARVRHLELNPLTRYVDGAVSIYDDRMTNVVGKYQPGFRGNPLHRLFSMDDRCFFGLTWMIRRNREFSYSMKEGLTHGEDLLFYIDISRQGGYYDYINDVVLHYRRHAQSAMRNLDGLHNGYKQIFNILKAWPEFSIAHQARYLLKVKKIMALSYWSDQQYGKAFLSLLS